MTEEEIRADERGRVAARLETAAHRYAALNTGDQFVRGVRTAAYIAIRDTMPARGPLALVKTP